MNVTPCMLNQALRVAVVYRRPLSMLGHRVPNPRVEVVEVALPRLEKSGEQGVGFIGVDIEAPAVEPQEDVRREERDPLVAVDEGMIHEQRLEKSRGHADQWAGFGIRLAKLQEFAGIVGRQDAQVALYETARVSRSVAGEISAANLVPQCDG